MKEGSLVLVVSSPGTQLKRNCNIATKILSSFLFQKGETGFLNFALLPKEIRVGGF